MQNSDLFFIRHAQSELNRAYHNYLVGKNVPHSWKVLCQRPDFLELVKYNHDYIDCSITQLGRAQCDQAKVYADKIQPDVILVSPLLRTLQTCENLFGHRNIPIIVEPILSEALRSSCDISKDINQKIVKYPHFNFVQQLKDDDLWFIKNQCPEHQQAYHKAIEGIDPLDHNRKCDQILKLMKQTLIYENPKCMRQRAAKIKQLLKKYKQKYNKIAIVAHFCTINYTVSHIFNDNDQPLQVHIKNCQIYATTMKKLLNEE